MAVGERCLALLFALSLFSCFSLGNAVFILNPMNVSTCTGSASVFSCAINESLTIIWFINGNDSQKSGFIPTTLPLTPGPGFMSQLKVNATIHLQGASVSCTYVNSLRQVYNSTKAYLTVQGPPTNLTIIQLNATIYKMDWGQSDVQFPFLFTYNLEVKNENGTVVYKETVNDHQFVINSLDPCDRYLATVTARCQNTSEEYVISARFIGDQLSPILKNQITDTFVFVQDNLVNMTISQPGVCYFRMEAVYGSNISTVFPHLTPLLSNGGQRIAAVSLPSNKLYTINITSYNVYGHSCSTFTMSTFDIIGITNYSNLTCIFNTGSLARGCLLKIIDPVTNEMAYCKEIVRSLNTSPIMPQCSTCNGPLNSGVYIVEAYDIESDGSVSTVPAVRVNVTLPGSSTCTPSSGMSSGAIIGAIIGGAVGGAVFVSLIVLVCKIFQHKYKPSGPSDLNIEPSGPSDLNLEPSGPSYLNIAIECTSQPISSQEYPPARWGHVAALYEDNLYIWGGCIPKMSENTNNSMKDIYIFNPALKQWGKKTTEDEPPSSRHYCAYANDLSKVYIFGGRGTKEEDRYNDLYCLDLNNRRWTMCENKSDEDNTPGCKSGAGMVVWNGKLVLFGGYGYPQKKVKDNINFRSDEICNMGWTNDLHVYNPSDKTWTPQPKTDATPKPCAYFSFVNLGDDRIVTIGGNDKVNKTTNVVRILHLRKMEWSTVAIQHETDFPGVDCTSANLLTFEHNSKCIFILGGWQSHNEVVGDMWECIENKEGIWKFNKRNLADVSKEKWLIRCYHTSTAFQLEDPTHVKVVVFGGCYADPDGVTPENAPPTCEPNTIVLDIRLQTAVTHQSGRSYVERTQETNM